MTAVKPGTQPTDVPTVKAHTQSSGRVAWLLVTSVLTAVTVIASLGPTGGMRWEHPTLLFGLATASAALCIAVATVVIAIAVVVGLGTMLGKIMAESGAATRIATTLIRLFGEQRVHWDGPTALRR